MPLIRYTYGPDIRKHGDQPFHVSELTAKVLVDQNRRAVRVEPAELESLTKPQLAEVAEQAGVDVRARDPKADLIDKIAEADQS